MELARDLFDERFDTAGRSIVLINNPTTVLEQPMATVTNLRATLKEIGSAIDRDDDVVMVYLESHGGRDHHLAVDFPPLELDQLTPEMLRASLDESGIKWRIVIVSACYSGGYIEPLKDDFTLILTASAADRTSFGCGTESNATYFADALFQHALRFEDSFVKAFEQARERIAAREREQKVSPPSDPQMFIGDEMAAKLPKLEAALRARRASGTI
jgi:Peptidase C13 family